MDPRTWLWLQLFLTVSTCKPAADAGQLPSTAVLHDPCSLWQEFLLLLHSEDMSMSPHMATPCDHHSQAVPVASSPVRDP